MSATSPFAQAIAAQNDAVVGLLANVNVTLAGVVLPALFNAPFYNNALGDMGVAASQTSITLLTSSVPPQIIDWLTYFEEPFNPNDLLVSVDGVAYKIVAHEPNGSGLSRLILECA